MAKIGRRNDGDAPKWYASFFKLVAGDDLIPALINNRQQVLDLISAIPPEKADFRYAENKWTVKQLFIHLIDEERYYTYKAFCYSRQVNVFLEIPQGDAYNRDFNADNRTMEDIADEFATVRDAMISLFRTMTPEMLDFKDFPVQDVYTARSLGWFTVGHNIHHCNLLKEKYLSI